MWVVLYSRVPFRLLIVRVPYYIEGLKCRVWDFVRGLGSLGGKPLALTPPSNKMIHNQASKTFPFGGVLESS